MTVNVFPPRHPFFHISGSLIDPVLHSSASLDQKAAQRDLHIVWVERVRLLRRLLEAGSFKTEFGGQSSSVSTSPAAELDPMEVLGQQLHVPLPNRPRRISLGIKVMQSSFSYFMVYENWASKTPEG
jgi:hypothetical protein